jgi:hypothetical protein
MAGFFVSFYPIVNCERSAATIGGHGHFANPPCLPMIATSPHRSLLSAAPRKDDGVRRASGGLSKIKQALQKLPLQGVGGLANLPTTLNFSNTVSVCGASASSSVRSCPAQCS